MLDLAIDLPVTSGPLDLLASDRDDWAARSCRVRDSQPDPMPAGVRCRGRPSNSPGNRFASGPERSPAKPSWTEGESR